MRTPFGDFQLKFAKPGPGGTSKVKVVESPEALKAWPAKTGPKVPGTRAPLGPGKVFRDYYEAEEAIGRWAEEVYEARWSGEGIIHKDRRAEVAQGAIGEMWADPGRQPGVRQALATLTGRTEITGFVGVEGLAWMDEPMWALPIDWNRTGGLLTDLEKDLLRDTERLAHLAYASEHYRIAEAAMGQGLVEEADIAMMQGRLADLRAEKVVMKEAGATEGSWGSCLSCMTPGARTWIFSRRRCVSSTPPVSGTWGRAKSVTGKICSGTC